jgi:hypothetical protein
MSVNVTIVGDRLTKVEDNQTEIENEIVGIQKAQRRSDEIMVKVNEKVNDTDRRTKQLDVDVKGLVQCVQRLDSKVNDIGAKFQFQKVKVSNEILQRKHFSVNDVLLVEGSKNFQSNSDFNDHFDNSHAKLKVDRSFSSETSDESDQEPLNKVNFSLAQIRNDDSFSKVEQKYYGSIKCPPYSGDTDIENDKKQCDAIASQHKWSDELLATHIIANLEGDARNLLTLMTKEQMSDLQQIWLTLSCDYLKTEVS